MNHEISDTEKREIQELTTSLDLLATNKPVDLVLSAICTLLSNYANQGEIELEMVKTFTDALIGAIDHIESTKALKQ